MSPHGICFECGTQLRASHVTAQVDGNPVRYHHACAKQVEDELTACVLGESVQFGSGGYRRTAEVAA